MTCAAGFAASESTPVLAVAFVFKPLHLVSEATFKAVSAPVMLIEPSLIWFISSSGLSLFYCTPN